jgi:arylsulfatase A-like enzyme
MDSQAPSMESPNGLNLVVVVVDTLRYDHVAANPGADPAVETPNLDRLADRSWRFTNAYISGFPTMAARRDMLTGRYGAPFNRWTPFERGPETLPGALADAGYVTQLIHDTPHMVNGGHGFDVPFHAWTPIRGAEVDRAWITDSFEWPDDWAFDDRFDDYDFDERSVFEDNHVLPRYVQSRREWDDPEAWNVARLFRTAADFLRDNADRENAFLWVDCFDPHEPWDVPPEFLRRFDERDDGRIDPRSFRSAVTRDPDIDPAAERHLDAQYKAKVAFVDHWFGRFLDALDDTGLGRNTAVVVVGDHGTNLNDQPGRGFGKVGPPLQNEARVPLLLHVPDGGSGTCDAVVQPQDLFATVAALGGAAVPRVAESHDLLTVARDDHRPRDIALSGVSADGWAESDPDDVLFSAFDGEWCLGVTPDRDAARLWRRGDHEEVADANPEVVDRLYGAALDEVERRGLDPSLGRWLRHGGGPFPDDARFSDSPPRPDAWESYWDPDFFR